MLACTGMKLHIFRRVRKEQWLRGRASDSRLRGLGFESCSAVLKPWADIFTLHCSSSLRCINEYLAIDSCGYVHAQPSRINCSIWLDASQRSWDGVWLNRSAGEVKWKSALSNPEDWILRCIRTYLSLGCGCMTHMGGWHTWVRDTHGCVTHVGGWHTWVRDTHGCETHVDAWHTWVRDTRVCETHVGARHMGARHVGAWHTWMRDTRGCETHLDAWHTWMHDTRGCVTHVDAWHTWVRDTWMRDTRACVTRACVTHVDAWHTWRLHSALCCCLLKYHSGCVLVFNTVKIYKYNYSIYHPTRYIYVFRYNCLHLNNS